MNIYSIDFEKVVKSYKNYVSQMLDLEQTKMQHQSEMEPFKKEMEALIASSNSGLIVDESTQQKNIRRFKDIQVEASKKENEFRSNFSEEQTKIMESSFEEVSAIVSDCAKGNGIDMVVSKSQLVFVRDEFDLTDEIINLLKSRDLFYENEKES
jgi:Skp family chaperone for outer membrane proteins